MSRFKPVLGIVLGCLLTLFLVTSCKGLPKPAQPDFPLDFDRIEASEPEKLDLYFTLKAENPRNVGVTLSIDSHRLLINGEEASEESTLTFLFQETGDSTQNETNHPYLGPLEKGEFPVLLRLEPKAQYDTTELTVKLVADLGLALNNKKKISAVAQGTAKFPYVREPVFSITSITILQAELINTRLKVRIRVENPNYFPVELFSFAYSLYGAGRFWADGTEKNACTIAPFESIEKDLFLVMNFIDMRRDLLDQVIAMKNVSYRFTGTAEIGTAVDYLPLYTKPFDLQGESAVER